MSAHSLVRLSPKILRFKSFAQVQQAPAWLVYCVVDVTANVSIQGFVFASDVAEFFSHHNRTHWLGFAEETFLKIKRLLAEKPSNRRSAHARRLLEGRGKRVKRITSFYDVFRIDQQTGAAL